MNSSVPRWAWRQRGRDVPRRCGRHMVGDAKPHTRHTCTATHTSRRPKAKPQYTSLTLSILVLRADTVSWTFQQHVFLVLNLTTRATTCCSLGTWFLPLRARLASSSAVLLGWGCPAAQPKLHELTMRRTGNEHITTAALENHNPIQCLCFSI